MPRQVTDDEVLQLMTELDLDAEMLTDFRTVRHYLRYDVPNCCVAFNLKVLFPIDLWTPDLEKADRWIDQGGLRNRLGSIAIDVCTYRCWARDRIGKGLGYAPCPACVLAKRFVDIPEGCPCCADEAQDKPATPA